MRSLFVITVFFLLGCSEKEEITELKLAHGLDVNHPVHLGIVDFAERVEDKSDGKLKIQIYQNCQLGGERELL